MATLLCDQMYYSCSILIVFSSSLKKDLKAENTSSLLLMLTVLKFPWEFLSKYSGECCCDNRGLLFLHNQKDLSIPIASLPIGCNAHYQKGDYRHLKSEMDINCTQQWDTYFQSAPKPICKLRNIWYHRFLLW